jgi:hypothetical protein
MRDIYIIFAFAAGIVAMLGLMMKRRSQRIDAGNAYLQARQQALGSKAQQVTVTRLGRSDQPRMFAGSNVGMTFYFVFFDIHYVDTAGNSGIVTTPVPEHAMASVAPGKVIIVKATPSVLSNLIVDFDQMGFALDHRWSL